MNPRSACTILHMAYSFSVLYTVIKTRHIWVLMRAQHPHATLAHAYTLASDIHATDGLMD